MDNILGKLDIAKASWKTMEKGKCMAIL